MNYLVEKPVGKFPKGSAVTEKDFVEGRAQELVRSGVLSPTDGSGGALPEPKDAAGWKKRAQFFEEENRQLRVAKDGPETLAKLKYAEEENTRLKAQVQQVQNANSELASGAVRKADYDNLNDQFNQLKTLHASTEKELDEAKVLIEKATKPQ